MICPLTDIARVDLSIRQGNSYSLTVQIPGDVPLDAFSFRGQIRRTPRDPVKVADLAVSLLPDRWLLLALTSVQTAAIQPGRYVYDVEAFTEGDAFVCTILEGVALVTPTSTRVEITQ